MILIKMLFQKITYFKAVVKYRINLILIINIAPYILGTMNINNQIILTIMG